MLRERGGWESVERERGEGGVLERERRVGERMGEGERGMGERGWERG